MLKTAKDFAKKPKKYFVELNKNISLQNITYNKKLLENQSNVPGLEVAQSKSST